MDIVSKDLHHNTMTKKKLCCVGHITKDKIITPKNEFSLSGGTAFYFAHAINALPKAVQFELITKVGDNAKATVVELKELGIDVQNFDSENTVYFENKYGNDPNHRTQRVLAKADAFEIQDVVNSSADIYHIGSLLNDDFSPEVLQLLAQKGLLSIDAQGFLRRVEDKNVLATNWYHKQEILEVTHFLKVNEHEMEVLTNYKDPREAAQLLAEMGVKEVIITLGSYGSLIYTDNTFYEIPAYKPAQLIDVTGCGDTYMAGYLYGRATGMGVQESGELAARMCTRKIEASGPLTSFEQ